jgi:hypothetical protein
LPKNKSDQVSPLEPGIKKNVKAEQMRAENVKGF